MDLVKMIQLIEKREYISKVPVPIKNPRIPLTPPKRKHTWKELCKYKRDKIKAYCRSKNLPYVRLNKSQLIRNILLWQEGKEVKYPETYRTWSESKQANHRITSQMRKFALDYATNTKRKTQKEWAKEFHVSPVTLNQWLQWHEIIDLIARYRENIEAKVTEKFIQNQDIAVDELIALITSRRTPPEVKRKAISDFLGFAGRRNINATKVAIAQKQSQGLISEADSMTIEEINRQLEELDELENG